MFMLAHDLRFEECSSELKSNCLGTVAVPMRPGQGSADTLNAILRTA